MFSFHNVSVIHRKGAVNKLGNFSCKLSFSKTGKYKKLLVVGKMLLLHELTEALSIINQCSPYQMCGNWKILLPAMPLLTP